MSARADILSNIRRSMGVTGTERPRVVAVEDRLERAPRGVTVERGRLPQDERLALFIAQVKASLASVDEVENRAAVPAAIADYLRANNLPARIRRGDDPRFGDMPWSDTALEIDFGKSDGKDLAAVNHAFAGVAETGTVVMTAGHENPTTLNFLPDYAIAVIDAKDVTGDYEEMWSKLRFAYGKGGMPRVVNWITGPSRSADIEQTMLLGAHGPRSLHVIVVKG